MKEKGRHISTNVKGTETDTSRELYTRQNQIECDVIGM